jgi:peptidoglycan L-alanyl-D-glutamate endopeptidase CwlK
MNIEEIISFVQKVLGIPVDGKAGPETWEAIYKGIVRKKAAAKQSAL